MNGQFKIGWVLDNKVVGLVSFQDHTELKVLLKGYRIPSGVFHV